MHRVLPWVLLLAACESVPVPPPTAKETAIVALQVRTRSGIETTYPDRAWFVRLDEPGDPSAATELLESNYHRAGHIYLLDAAPGWYYVVACAELIDGKTHYTYFPRDTILATETRVEPGTFTYAGLVQLTKRPGLGRADEAQLHFAARIDPQPTNPHPLQTLFPRTRAFTGSDATLDRSPERAANARRRARDFLARHGWAERLEGATPPAPPSEPEPRR